MISILIPAYNEEATIYKLIKKVANLKTPQSQEIIVVNDGSTDKTAKLLEKASQIYKIKIIENRTNLGKGQSIIKALKLARGDIIIIQDADMEYDPNDLPQLLKHFKNIKIDVVYGSRILGNNSLSHWTFYLGGRLVTFVTNLLYGTKITDEPTGYKLFRAKVIKSLKLRSKGFEFCPEVTAKIAKKGIKIYEYPISYNPRSITEKKIKWTDGILAIFYLLKYRFSD